jgi:hypothetical protein
MRRVNGEGIRMAGDHHRDIAMAEHVLDHPTAAGLLEDHPVAVIEWILPVTLLLVAEMMIEMADGEESIVTVALHDVTGKVHLLGRSGLISTLTFEMDVSRSLAARYSWAV